MELLFQSLMDNGLIEGENIILQNPGIKVSKEVFLIFFGDVADNPTHARLSGSHTFMWGNPSASYTRTAAQLGYQGCFDEWLSLGILS